MRLFFYYVFHSAKNALKKLFKTWVLVFIVVMLAGGMLVGLTLGTFLDKVVPSDPDTPPSQQEEVVPTPEDQAEVKGVVELAAGGIILLVFILNVLGADKSGSEIFLPADVNMLFASPMKPQSVLLFRTMTQMGASLLFIIYILAFQIPNLVNSGLGLSGILAIVFGLMLMLSIAQLLKMLCYVTASSHPGFKANLRRIVYAVLLLIVGGFILYKQGHSGNWWEAAKGYFNAPLTRWIPLWGWIKGFVMFVIEGNLLRALLCMGLVILSGVLLAVLIWRMKADFYEEALKKTDEKAELLASVNAEGNARLMKRKKDRDARYSLQEFDRGWGANVFFHKAMFNRFRFAHLHFFTKTMEFYLALCVGVALLCRFVIVTTTPLPIVLALAFCAFYRSLGNSLKEDTTMWFFHMIPEENVAKLGWSLLGDLCNCLLDLLPGFAIGLIVQGASLPEALVYIPAILSVTAYSTIVGTFIDMSVSVNAGKMIKQMVQAMFIYFGLLPDIGLVILLSSLGLTAWAALGIALVNLLLTGLFLYLASLVMGTK